MKGMEDLSLYWGSPSHKESEKVSGNASLNIVAGKGELVVHGNVQIWEKLIGRIDVKGQLTVNAKAVVIANISAENLVLHGTVIGDIFVKNSLILHQDAKVIGSVTATEAMLYQGHKVSGTREFIKVSSMDEYGKSIKKVNGDWQV
jgi:cytoskeletal protein CcmA (bactofilin family)